MAVLNSSDQITALELIKRNGYSADQRRIIEAMSITNQILWDIPVFEANDGAVHTHLVRKALPAGERRKLNQGVGTMATQTDTKQDIITEVAGESIVDAKLVERAIDRNQFLMDEASGIMEGMGITQADDLIYGDNKKDPASVNGLATRRNKLGDLCWNFKGSGNALTSVYICKMGRQGVGLIHGRGTEGVGVTRTNYGKGMVDMGNGKRMEAYQNYFSAEYGLSVGDERSLIRIANIAANADADELVAEVLRAYRKLMPGDGSVVLYGNADILHKIDMSITNKGNVNYAATDPLGRETQFLRNIRLRQVDSIRNDESAIS